MRIFSFLVLISITVAFASGQNETAKEPLSIVVTVETPVVKAGSGVSVNGASQILLISPLMPAAAIADDLGSTHTLRGRSVTKRGAWLQREFTHTQNLQPAAQF